MKKVFTPERNKQGIKPIKPGFPGIQPKKKERASPGGKGRYRSPAGHGAPETNRCWRQLWEPWPAGVIRNGPQLLLAPGTPRRIGPAPCSPHCPGPACRAQTSEGSGCTILTSGPFLWLGRQDYRWPVLSMYSLLISLPTAVLRTGSCELWSLCRGCQAWRDRLPSPLCAVSTRAAVSISHCRSDPPAYQGIHSSRKRLRHHCGITGCRWRVFAHTHMHTHSGLVTQLVVF